MSKDNDQIIATVVAFLKDKLYSDYGRMRITSEQIQWVLYDETPPVPSKDNELKMKKDVILSKVCIFYVDHKRREDYDCNYLIIEATAGGANQSSNVPIRWLARYRKPIRDALKLIKEAQRVKVCMELSRIDSIQAKISPERLDDILLGDKDE